MISTDHVSEKDEDLVRSLTETRARGETPNPSPRTDPRTARFMAGAVHRKEGSRAESDKVPTSRLLDGGRTRERPAGAQARVNAGNGSGRMEETRGWDDDTSSVVDGCAKPSVDGMAPRESDAIARRHRFRRRRADNYDKTPLSNGPTHHLDNTLVPPPRSLRPARIPARNPRARRHHT